MRKNIFRTALLVSFLLWPFSALADTPANVTGLSARFEGGQVTVRWDEVENADTYRVYYGQKSILDNDGAYDDFMTTDGGDTELVLTDLPPYQKIFIAVLAVNADGEESLSFVEEVQLDVVGDAMDGEKTEREASAAEPDSATAVDETAASQNVDVSQGVLFDSGMPILGVLMVSGALIGWKRMRRQTTVS